MSITIKDIAKLAGVSTSTVSLVISGKGYISEGTREKVQKVIDEFNYRPLRSARQLAANRTGNVGFIISDVHLSRSEAFYSRILLGAELEARNYGAYLLLSSVPADFNIPENIPRFLKGRDVDGVIIAGSVPENLIKYIHNEKIAFVLVDYTIPDIKTDTVIMDNRSGMGQVIEHLVRQGIRHIGFVAGSNYHPSIHERFEGYQTSMEKHKLGKISRDPRYYYLDDTETTAEIGEKGMSEILKNVPHIEAVICANDTTATGCLRYLSKIGKHVPGDISVAGFDNVNYAAMTYPPLTTIHVPKIEMGVSAMKLLMDRIENPDQLSQIRLMPVDLVVRDSSRKKRVDHP